MNTLDMAPALRERLGAEASVGLLALFMVARQEWTAEMTPAAVERFEHRLSAEIGGLRAEFREDLRREIGGLREEVRAELRTEIGGLREEVRAELRAEIGGLREEVRAEIAGLREEFRGHLNTSIGSLREELREIRRDLMKVYQEQVSSRFTVVKWCFVFWVGQAIAVTGLVGVMLRFIRS